MRLIDGSHYGAKLTDLERTVIRLWIDTSATYPGTYASLGCGSFPPGIPYGPLVARCGSCHLQDRYYRRKKVKTMVFGNLAPQGQGYEAACNLSHPEKSLVLRASLAKEAGGLGLCKKIVFADTQDPLYQKTLAALQAAHDRLLQENRFDWAGFRPNKDYIREMQRFGFLPKTLGENDPVDPYAVDRAYWDSFLYRHTQAHAASGFAIPGNTVRRVGPDLITSGSYAHPWLGVEIFDLGRWSEILQEAGEDVPDEGVLILSIVRNSPAAKAGLRGGNRNIVVGNSRFPAGGDIITALNGEPVPSWQDLNIYLELKTQVGETVQVTVLRDGEEIVVPVVLAERP